MLGVIACLGSSAVAAEPPPALRAGIIGLDTSHVAAFTKLLNNPNATGDLAGVKVVAAFPGGSPDLPASRDRVEGFTNQLRNEFHVDIVDSIDDLLQRVDVVLLESVDGRPHLKQAEPVFKARKPMFIDKPLAGSLADAIRIAKLSEKYQSPFFTSSSLRFSASIMKLKTDPKIGDILGCTTFGPSPIEEHHPDFFWYGIHGIESLYTVMGTGCESVTRVSSEGTDLVVGKWKNGRIGTFRGIRAGKSDYGGITFGSKGIVYAQGYGGYEPLLLEVCKFFRTGQPPVKVSETLEMFAFMEAADESKRQGGATVTIESVMRRAQEEAGHDAQ